MMAVNSWSVDVVNNASFPDVLILTFILVKLKTEGKCV